MSMLILSCNSLFAQNCNLKTLKDEYASHPSVSVVSEDVTLGGAFRMLGDALPWHLDMKFFLDDGQLSLLVTHHHSRTNSTSSLNSIFFLFKDGTSIKKENPLTTGQFKASGTLTGFFVTKEELELFASKDLLKFKVDFKNFDEQPIFEENIKQKSIDKIRKDASCMLLEFNSVSNAKKEDKKEIKDVSEYKCSYEMDKIDAFTKKRSVLTKASLFVDEKVQGGHTFFQVSGNNTNGINGLKFWYCINVNGIGKVVEYTKSIMLFDQVEILLENDEQISLNTGAISEFLFQSQVNAAWSFKLFTIEDDSIWQKLKTTPLKTLRLSKNGQELWTREIDKKYSKSFMNVINCVDVLGIPKSK